MTLMRTISSHILITTLEILICEDLVKDVMTNK